MHTYLRIVVEAIRVKLLRCKLGPEVDLHQARESLRSWAVRHHQRPGFVSSQRLVVTVEECECVCSASVLDLHRLHTSLLN